jgi:predicted nucleotidyltransferase
MIDEKKIDEVTEKLVETYYPREIYLFGSYAWGKPSEESDLDLLIIVDELEQEPWKA